MKILNESIAISGCTHDTAGNQLEPEEQVLEHHLNVASTLSLTSGKVISSAMPGSISVDVPVGDYANQMRAKCEACTFFDRVGWRKRYVELQQSSSREDAVFLNGVRAAIDQASDDSEIAAQHADPTTGYIDLDRAVFDLGLCRAMTEIQSSFLKKEHLVVVAPEGGCPDHLGPRGEPLAALFRARDYAAAKAGGKMHASVMHAARSARNFWKRIKGGNAS